jgi:hypothetical protein
MDMDGQIMGHNDTVRHTMMLNDTVRYIALCILRVICLLQVAECYDIVGVIPRT